jgi:hypothetical protein
MGIMTDVGNDLVYGVRPEIVTNWAIEAAQRLGAHCDRVVVTGLPLISLARARSWQLRALRRLFFPFTRIDLEQAVARAADVDRALREWVAQQQQQVDRWYYVSPASDWYGWDPIHIRPRRAYEAWCHLLAPLLERLDSLRSLDAAPQLADALGDHRTSAHHSSLGNPRPKLRSTCLPRTWQLRWAAAARRELFGRALVTQQPSLCWDENCWLALF